MAERISQYKWFWVWDYEKEERWLNEMAAQGWALCEVGFARYSFERTEPGAYIVRTEMRGVDPAHRVSVEESGAEYIGRMAKWIYFRRRSELGDFALFSDLGAKMEHLRQIYRMLLLIGLGNLLIGLGNSVNESHLGWINLLLASLLMYGCGVIRGRLDSLESESKKEKQR